MKSLPLFTILVGLSLGMGCDAIRGDDWPLEVSLGAHVQASPIEARPRNVDFVGQAAPSTSSYTLTPGVYSAADLWVSAEREFVLVSLDDGARWVEMPAPISASARTFLQRLAGEGIVHVQFFADGDRAIASSEEGTRAIRLTTRRDRMLDHNTATLEGCRMLSGGLKYECSLDLSWDMATFDPDGVELDGSFQPAWMY